MVKVIRKLFSKALLLTYFFVGYLAITDHVIPESHVDAAPAFQVDQMTVPGSPAFRIFTAKHIRPDNFAPIILAECPISQPFNFQSNPLLIKLYSAPVLAFVGYSSLTSSRAPPVS